MIPHEDRIEIIVAIAKTGYFRLSTAFCWLIEFVRICRMSPDNCWRRDHFPAGDEREAAQKQQSQGERQCFGTTLIGDRSINSRLCPICGSWMAVTGGSVQSASERLFAGTASAIRDLSEFSRPRGF